MEMDQLEEEAQTDGDKEIEEMVALKNPPERDREDTFGAETAQPIHQCLGEAGKIRGRTNAGAAIRHGVFIGAIDGDQIKIRLCGQGANPLATKRDYHALTFDMAVSALHVADCQAMHGANHGIGNRGQGYAKSAVMKHPAERLHLSPKPPFAGTPFDFIKRGLNIQPPNGVVKLLFQHLCI